MSLISRDLKLQVGFRNKIMSFSFPKEKIKILLLENIHESAVENFKVDGFDVEKLSGSLSEKDLLARARDIHVLGIRSKTQIPSSFFESAKKLLGVGCFCIGTNQVDLEQAKKSGVPVFNAPYSNTRSVAEMVIAEIIMLSRRLGDRNNDLHQGIWNKNSKNSFEVRGKTLGIVGYGNIGTQVGVLAESLGLKVLFFDVLTKMPIGNSRAMESLSALLSASDFVTLHVPETDSTKNLMNSETLKQMRKGAFLINASRGSVVDLKALAKEVETGHLAGCAVDVYPEEPLSNTPHFRSELQKLPNVILTPHIGGSTEEAQENIGKEVSDFLIRFINRGETTLAVNFPQADLVDRKEAHRILNVHHNIPGVLAEINAIMSALGANIQGQQLSTDSEIGYLIMDVDKNLSDQVKDQIANLSTSIKTRILY